MKLPYTLSNGVGNRVDHDKYMANMQFLLSLVRGNLLGNGGMESWDGGSSFDAPVDDDALATFWVAKKGGTAAPTLTVSREASEVDTGAYSMKVDMEVVGSSDSYFNVQQTFSNPAQFDGAVLVFGVMVKCSTASKVRVSVYDGTSTSYSSCHTGSGAFEKLIARHSCAESVSELTVKVEIVGDFVDSVYLDSLFLYEAATNIPAASVNSFEYVPPRPGQDFFIGEGNQIWCWNGLAYVILG